MSTPSNAPDTPATPPALRERIAPADIAAIMVAHKAMDELECAANVAVAKAALAKAEFEQLHRAQVRAWKLKPGDSYDEHGTITRGAATPSP